MVEYNLTQRKAAIALWFQKITALVDLTRQWIDVDEALAVRHEALSMSRSWGKMCRTR